MHRAKWPQPLYLSTAAAATAAMFVQLRQHRRYPSYSRLGLLLHVPQLQFSDREREIDRERQRARTVESPSRGQRQKRQQKKNGAKSLPGFKQIIPSSSSASLLGVPFGQLIVLLRVQDKFIVIMANKR